jgi:dTDP-4-amino-4,6-dideoxygalactose transaminase
MRVPMFDMAAHQAPFAADLKTAISAVIDSGRYVLGPSVSELEDRVADYLGVAHAVGVSSGTDALLVSLMALGIGPGDHVLTTPYSFFATAGAIVRVGARPVFADIDPETCALSADAVTAYLASSAGRAVKAVMPVHLFGQCVDMEPLLAAAERYGVPVIEDAAQALGAKEELSTGIVGAGTMGDLGCFSFYPSKNLGGVGDAGMVVTSNAALADRIRTLRQHGATATYRHVFVGGNFRMDAIQAAALLVKFGYLEGWHQDRRERSLTYDRGLESLPLVTPLGRRVQRSSHIYNQYVIRVCGGRDALATHLRERGVDSATYYPVPFHLQPCFSGLGYAEGAFPESERAAGQTLALPIHPDVSKVQQAHVLHSLATFFEKQPTP